MNARDIIDEIILKNGNMESLFEIFENSIIELDKNTSNSRDRKKILKALNQFSVIMQALYDINKSIYKDCYALWNAVLTLEEQIPNKK